MNRWTGAQQEPFTNLEVLQSVDIWVREPVFLLPRHHAPDDVRIHLQLPLGVRGQRVLEEALI